MRPSNRKFILAFPGGRARLAILTLAVMIAAAFLPITANADEPDWEPVGPGIEFRRFQLPDPNNVYVARMDRDHPDVTMESAIAQGRLSGGIETVRGMAARYDGAVNYWGEQWGARNQVVVAINGSFHDVNGIPESGLVHSGWYAKRFDDLGGGTGFAWRQENDGVSAFGVPFIGECVTHNPLKQYVADENDDVLVYLDKTNGNRGAGKVVLFTPQYDSTTGTNDNGWEFLIELERPAMVLPKPAYARGFIREIRADLGATSLPFGHVVLSVHTDGLTPAVMGLQVGDEVRITQEMTHFESDCSTPNPESWTKTYASISGGDHFLKDGLIQSPGVTPKHPRTAIAFNDEYVFFIVVDGRDPANSVGMTIDELALFARDTLGATDGIEQDGGGSSTMVVNGVVQNNTHCNHVVCDEPPEDPGEHRIYIPMQSSSAYVGVQRPVANAMMMVVVEPKVQSLVFNADDVVEALEATQVRLGPGASYGSLATVSAGAVGVILEHFNDLDGVYAKREYWWLVDFGGKVGWVAESTFAPYANALYDRPHLSGIR